MSHLASFDQFLLIWVAVAAVFFVSLFIIDAPYGRHARAGWGPQIPSTLGWVIMEAVSPIAMFVYFLKGDREANVPALVFLGLWELHYINRAFIFPFRRRGGAKPMPLVVALLAVGFNFGNTWVNGRWLFALGPVRDTSWFLDPRFIVGVALFLAGFWMNLDADAVLRNLRKPGETGYKIPHGGLYRFISAPNYFCEMIEWCGFALATWSLPGLTFAAWTIANLLPRAIANHRWYREKFPDYPPERRAVIPFLL